MQDITKIGNWMWNAFLYSLQNQNYSKIYKFVF